MPRLGRGERELLVVVSADIAEHCGVIFVAMPRFHTMVHFKYRKTNKEEMNKSEEIVSVLQGLIKTTWGQQKL